MLKILYAAAGAMALLAVATPSVAAVNVRQLNQERRIDAGVRSGKLTPYEARKLKSEQRLIARQKAAAKARHGGHLTRADKARIHGHQEAANRHIKRLKHNRANR